MFSRVCCMWPLEMIALWRARIRKWSGRWNRTRNWCLNSMLWGRRRISIRRRRNSWPVKMPGSRGKSINLLKLPPGLALPILDRPGGSLSRGNSTREIRPQLSTSVTSQPPNEIWGTWRKRRVVWLQPVGRWCFRTISNKKVVNFSTLRSSSRQLGAQSCVKIEWSKNWTNDCWGCQNTNFTDPNNLLFSSAKNQF